MAPALILRDLSKDFVLHLQGGTRIPVLKCLSLAVEPGRCVVLGGRSGVGKSTVLKLVWGSYLAERGSICIDHRGELVELVGAAPRTMLDVRRHTLGYVSQFLRVVPRVAAIDIVAEPLIARGAGRAEAGERAAAMLRRLRIPERLWPLPPATFSGGEQQRVNVARGLACGHFVLLLDEPTASLDKENREVLVELILEAKRAGTACLGIFHDAEVRDAVADQIVDLERERRAA